MAEVTEQDKQKAAEIFETHTFAIDIKPDGSYTKRQCLTTLPSVIADALATERDEAVKAERAYLRSVVEDYYNMTATQFYSTYQTNSPLVAFDAAAIRQGESQDG